MVSVPSGDFLFFNHIPNVNGIPVAEFPSPPGTSYFLIYGHGRKKKQNYVSVPSGDFLFFNGKNENIELLPQVSVPSGDFLFFNGKLPELSKITALLFPSPPGTSYFLIADAGTDSYRYKPFPSPPGTSYFLIITRCSSDEKKLGFRPLRGLLIF